MWNLIKIEMKSQLESKLEAEKGNEKYCIYDLKWIESGALWSVSPSQRREGGDNEKCTKLIMKEFILKDREFEKTLKRNNWW